MNPETNDKHTETSPEIFENMGRRSSSWDIRNAPKNFFSLIILQGGSSLFAFASVLLITKVLGSEGYGGIVAIIAASQIAQVLVNWTSFSLVKFGAEEFVESEKISRIFWVRILIFIPNLLLVLLASQFWFPPLADWLKLSTDAFYLVILHFVATALWIHVQYSLQGIKKQRIQGGLLAAERLAIFLGLVALAFAEKLNPLNALLFYSFAPLLMAIVGIWLLRRYIFSTFSITADFLKEIFTYSLPLLPFSLVGYFSGSYIDAVFISKFLSTNDLGIYSVASQINGLALQIPTLANSLLIPFFVTLQKENRSGILNRYFQHAFPSLTLVGGLACVLASFAAYFFIPLIFGAEFKESVLPLWILLTASVFALPGLIGYAALVHSSGQTYIATIAVIFSAGTNIISNFILIPKYGMAGCAWATVLTFFISVLTFAILLRRNIKIPLSWVFIAMLPSFLSAAVFSYFRNPWTALIVCITSTMIIIFLKKDSIRESFSTIKNVRNAQ